MGLLAKHFAYFTNDLTVVVISDRDKGLAEAMDEKLLLVIHNHCYQHIANNVQSLYRKGAQNLFWPIAYTTTIKTYDKAIRQLAVLRSGTADYL